MEIEYTKTGIVADGIEISLEEITEKVNEMKISEENLCLMKLEWQGGRNFDGAYEYRIMTLKNALEFKNIFSGAYINFGEIAGKHSEISGNLDDDEITIINDAKIVNSFLSANPNGLTYNHSFTDIISDNIYEGEYEYENENDNKFIDNDKYNKLFEC